MNQFVELMIHVDDSALKPQLYDRVAGMAGIAPSHLEATSPHLFFVSYDPERFDIRAIPRIAHDIGTSARLVGI